MESAKKTIIKVLVILGCILSLVLFMLKVTGVTDSISYKLLQTYDYDGNDKLVFLDVADGNSAIIQSENKTAIINFGGIKDGGNSLIKAIRKYNITKFDYAFITVCDEKHLGGFMAISDLVDIEKVIIPNIDGFLGENIITNNVVCEKIINNYKYAIVNLNQEYKVGNFSLTPLYYTPNMLTPSGRAVLYKISAYNYSALIGGSFDKDIMYELLATNQNIQADIFLLPGFSDNKNWNIPFINSLKAKYIVSSSAFKNDAYLQEDLELLSKSFILYRTDINGDISFYFNKDSLFAKTQR